VSWALSAAVKFALPEMLSEDSQNVSRSARINLRSASFHTTVDASMNKSRPLYPVTGAIGDVTGADWCLIKKCATWCRENSNES
jgi:hypothetical protein